MYGMHADVCTLIHTQTNFWCDMPSWAHMQQVNKQKQRLICGLASPPSPVLKPDTAGLLKTMPFWTNYRLNMWRKTRVFMWRPCCHSYYIFQMSVLWLSTCSLITWQQLLGRVVWQMIRSAVYLSAISLFNLTANQKSCSSWVFDGNLMDNSHSHSNHLKKMFVFVLY